MLFSKSAGERSALKNEQLAMSNEQRRLLTEAQRRGGRKGGLKMKYKRMVCWVNKRTKTELSKLNQQYNIPIVFVNSFEEFENNINEETFLLLIRRKADRNIRKLLKLINSFSKHTFFAYVQSGDPCTTPREFHFSREKNVVNCDMTDVFGLFQSYTQPDSQPPRNISEDELFEVLKTDPTLRGLAQAVSEEFDENGKYIGKY